MKPIAMNSSHAQAVSKYGNLRAENRAGRKGLPQLRPGPPERFKCLSETDPQLQLKAALKQIDALLHQNVRLKRCVVGLAQALSESRHLLQSGESGWYPSPYWSPARLHSRDLQEDCVEQDLETPD